MLPAPPSPTRPPLAHVPSLLATPAALAGFARRPFDRARWWMAVAPVVVVPPLRATRNGFPRTPLPGAPLAHTIS